MATNLAFMAVPSLFLGQIAEALCDRILGLLRKCGVPVDSPRLARDVFKAAMGDCIPRPSAVARASQVAM